MNKAQLTTAIAFILTFSLVWSETSASCRPEEMTKIPEGRYVIHDGEVYDSKTGLTWQRCRVGQQRNGAAGCVGAGRSYGWDIAKELVRQRNDSWRIPSLPELRSIATKYCQHPAMKDFPFVTDHDVYWTHNDDGRNRIATVHAPFGAVNYGSYFRDGAGLRLVRGPILLEMDDKDAQWLRRIELEKQLIAEMREKLPKNVGREFTGLDGAPMLLVPEGEFLYGKYGTGYGDLPRQRLSLPSFYMDKYKVTTRLYDSFLRATGRVPPQDWEQQVALIGSGDHPIVQITWEDANAYCRHYGKRIPTSQEWEKATRGTDGRKYPWGDEEPTPESQHMSFPKVKMGKPLSYADIAVVGTFPKGISPYGLHDLVSRIWEWTNDGGRPLRRGGSVEGVSYSVVEGAWRMNDGFRCVQDNP